MNFRQPPPFVSPGPQYSLGTGVMLSVRQVAGRLNVSRSLVYEEIKRGKLPAKKIGKCIRVSMRDLERYVHSTDEMEDEIG